MARQVKALPTPALDGKLSATLLGEAVRARRTQSGLTLHDAAALCGVARDTLMKVEHGSATVQLGSVLQICAALGIPLQVTSWQTDQRSNDDWN